jgi:anti-anti-sigma factor
VPVNRALRHNVCALLRQGERVIVLDLADVTQIDAAGTGELVRVFNLTAGVNGRLRITNASPWVRGVLERAGVFDLLVGEVEAEQRLA